MNAKTLGGIGAAAAIVAAAIFFLQNFDAGKVACDAIPDARAQLQAQYDAGVNASVQLFAEERAAAEARLSECLSAKPVDPCADAQAARDAAYKAFFDIPSPPDSAPYADFQKYFEKRDDAYNAYKAAKSALDQCRAANPPKGDVPYEESDTKACFDAYDASMQATQHTFDRDTQALRSAFNAALAALDAREKACHPPTEEKDKFTMVPGAGGIVEKDGVSVDLNICQLLDPNLDTELFTLRKQAAALTAQIQSVQTTLENAGKRVRALQVDLQGVDTYIPPESTKTQFEGALNALRGQRKANIQAALDYYQSLIERKQAEKSSLEQELRDVEAQIAARESAIERENEMRQSKYPTALHLAGPDACAYYHCHGTLCGLPDPAPEACGHGSTAPDDLECKEFFKSYLKAAGVQ
jgi:hypothetical protein